jgi:hypothetical protein
MNFQAWWRSMRSAETCSIICTSNEELLRFTAVHIVALKYHDVTGRTALQFTLHEVITWGLRLSGRSRFLLWFLAYGPVCSAYGPVCSAYGPVCSACGPVCSACGPVCSACGPVCTACGPVCSSMWVKMFRGYLLCSDRTIQCNGPEHNNIWMYN